MAYLKSGEFAKIVKEENYDITAIQQVLREAGMAEPSIRPNTIEKRIERMKRKGYLPLDSGNSVGSGESLRGVSTLYGADGKIKQQWVKTDVEREHFFEAYNEAIGNINIKPLAEITRSTTVQLSDLATLYISNDVHFGALMWDKESGSDWNVEIATSTMRSAYDYLFSTTPDSKVGIVCDLGE